MGGLIKVHILKIKKEYMMDIQKGIKTFEIRKNDRGFRVGDHILFNVLFDEEGIKHGPYVIKYILTDGCYGLDKDYVVLSIEKYNL